MAGACDSRLIVTSSPVMEADKPAIRRRAKGTELAVVQLAPVLGDLEANLTAHLEAIEEARGAGAELVVFPELSLTGYRLKDTVPELAMSTRDSRLDPLKEASAGTALVFGMVEEAPDHRFFNSAVYLEDGAVVAVHRKVYLPTYGMFDEQRYFARGNRLAAFNTKLGRMALLVCEDMLHPTALTVVAVDGASTVIVPSASPAADVTGQGEVDANGRHWESYNRVMARNLGLNVVYANRAGVEDGIAFWGGSEVIGPGGETLAKAAYYEQDRIAAVLAESAVRRRRIQSPVLRDEDLDLDINELSRIRGRQVVEQQREVARKEQDRFDRGKGGPRTRLKPERGERSRRRVEPGLAVVLPKKKD